MRNATSSLLPVLAALFALGVSGMPEGVAAQEGCTECVKEDNSPPECVPKLEGDGYDTCKVVKPNEDCELSSDETDCVADPGFDGRAMHEALHWASGVATGAVGGVEIPWWQQLVVPAAEKSRAVARQACTGAIVQRRYSPARITEIRAGLRRVTI